MITLNETYTYLTGATYNGSQELKITYVDFVSSDSWLDTFVFNVIDESRHMKITIKVEHFGNKMSFNEMIDGILDAYKTGNYEDGLSIVSSEEDKDLIELKQELISSINEIIEVCNTKKLGWNVCKRCEGSGYVTINHKYDLRSCFGCGAYKVGQNPNKWLKMKLDAEAMLTNWSHLIDQMMTDPDMLNDFKIFPHMRQGRIDSLRNSINNMKTKAGL